MALRATAAVAGTRIVKVSVSSRRAAAHPAVAERLLVAAVRPAVVARGPEGRAARVGVPHRVRVEVRVSRSVHRVPWSHRLPERQTYRRPT